MNWLYYLAEANIYLSVFYLAYCLFLSKETHYQLNRAYLLFSCIVSFLLPVLQIGALKPGAQGVENIVAGPVRPNPSLLQHIILWSYLIGVAIFLLQLLIKLYRLQKLALVKHAITHKQYKLIYIDDSNTAFSFFNYLFLGTNVTETELIIKHELVHMRQKHSADIFFMELFRLINWFNPVIYLLQNSLKVVHEYIADEETTNHETDTYTYAAFLVNNAYGLSGSSITHSFFNYNLLKKRIIMLHQKRSGSLARLKYLMAVPLCAGLLCESTLGFSKSYGLIDIAPQHLQKKDTANTKKKIKIIDVVLQPPPKKHAAPVSQVPPVKAQNIQKLPPPPPPKPPVKAQNAKKLAPPPPPQPPKN